MKKNLIKEFEGYIVQEFHHIDDSRCLQPLEAVYGDVYTLATQEDLQESVQELRKYWHKRFLECNWEGDGEIQVIIVPPFLFFPGVTNCEVIYHVKQLNNGTSFLGLPRQFEHIIAILERIEALIWQKR